MSVGPCAKDFSRRRTPSKRYDGPPRRADPGPDVISESMAAGRGVLVITPVLGHLRVQCLLGERLAQAAVEGVPNIEMGWTTRYYGLARAPAGLCRGVVGKHRSTIRWFVESFGA